MLPRILWAQDYRQEDAPGVFFSRLKILISSTSWMLEICQEFLPENFTEIIFNYKKCHFTLGIESTLKALDIYLPCRNIFSLV